MTVDSISAGASFSAGSSFSADSSFSAGNSFSADSNWAVDLGGIHVVFGDGGLSALGEQAERLRKERNTGRRVLLVTDPGIEKAGHAQCGVASLQAAGFEVEIFDGVRENPTTEHVAAGVEAARRHEAGMLVGLGGGSAMDCCKGINFLLTNGGEMEDYWGVDKAEQPMLPSIGVPTTAGTGSEGQRFALISKADSHVKMACGDRKARFRTVILDPSLISSMPREVAAVTGMDALSHAVESYVTTSRNPISQLFAREAWRLIERSFEIFLASPESRSARADMLLGAHLSGAAIEASMLGVAHSCANPLTSNFGITHGIAVGLMLPHVVRFNGSVVAGLYAELSAASRAQRNGNGHRRSEPDEPAEALAQRVIELRDAAGLPGSLSSCDVERGALAKLASEAADQWTARFNPRSVTAIELEGLYRDAFEETTS